MAIPSRLTAGATTPPSSAVSVSRWPSWLKNIPFLGMHAGCLLVFLPQVEATATAISLCVGFYVVRMFGITAGYHRYFSHRAYKTSRWFQFVLAWLGCSAMQKGPLWWSGHHRHHHLHSDQEEDIHSPIIDSFWWSHIGWVMSPNYVQTNWKAIHDFAKYPELRWLDNYHWVPGLLLGVISYLVGGLSGLVWGFFVSTVITYHATFCINSLCHLIGRVRYRTTDESRNSLLMALITMGEGWHNNHHHYQSSANQGFYWWEIDLSYYLLKALSWCGLVWDLRGVPQAKMVPTAHAGLVSTASQPPSIHPVQDMPAHESQEGMVLPVMNSARQAFTQAAQSATQALSTARQAASQAAHSAGEVISHAAEAAAHAANSARQVATHAAHSASQAVSHVAEAAASAASNAVNNVANTATTAAIAAVPALTVATIAAETLARGSGSS